MVFFASSVISEVQLDLASKQLDLKKTVLSVVAGKKNGDEGGRISEHF